MWSLVYMDGPREILVCKACTHAHGVRLTWDNKKHSDPSRYTTHGLCRAFVMSVCKKLSLSQGLHIGIDICIIRWSGESDLSVTVLVSPGTVNWHKLRMMQSAVSTELIYWIHQRLVTHETFLIL